MALITCPECNAEKISSWAKACPKCGFPVFDYLTKNETLFGPQTQNIRAAETSEEKQPAPKPASGTSIPYSETQRYEIELRQASSGWNRDPWIPLKVYEKERPLFPLYVYDPEKNSSRMISYKGILLDKTFIIRGNGFERSITFTEEFLSGHSYILDYKAFKQCHVTLDLEAGSAPDLLPLTKKDILNAIDFQKIRSDLADPCINPCYLSIILDILQHYGTQTDIDLIGKFSYKYPHHNIKCVMSLCVRCGYVSPGVKKHIKEHQTATLKSDNCQNNVPPHISSKTTDERAFEFDSSQNNVPPHISPKTTVERVFEELCAQMD